MALKFPKAFGRAAASLSPSQRNKVFGPSYKYDRPTVDSFNEGLIEGLDAQKGISRGFPENAAAGRMSWQSLTDDADRAITREAERRFANDLRISPIKFGSDDAINKWRDMSGKYYQDIIKDLKDGTISIQDLLEPLNDMWFR